MPSFVINGLILEPPSYIDNLGGRWDKVMKYGVYCYRYTPPKGKIMSVEVGEVVSIGTPDGISKKSVLHLAEIESNQYFFKKVALDDAMNAYILERDNQIKEKIIAEEKLRLNKILEREYKSALTFLNFHLFSYPPKETKSLLLKAFRSIFDMDTEKYYMEKIVKIAKDRLSHYGTVTFTNNSDSQKRKLHIYIMECGIHNDDSDFSRLVINTYENYYYDSRSTHCFRCRSRLVGTVSNECPTCGWIRCNCGGCGCNYSKNI